MTHLDCPTGSILDGEENDIECRDDGNKTPLLHVFLLSKYNNLFYFLYFINKHFVIIRQLESGASAPVFIGHVSSSRGDQPPPEAADPEQLLPGGGHLLLPPGLLPQPRDPQHLV